MPNTRTPIFFGARWVFWLLLAAPSVILVGNVCSQKDTAYQFVFPVIVVLACLWEAHVRTLLDQPSRGWRMLPRLLVRFVGTAWRLLLWMLLASLPVLILIPQYACYTDRARFSEVLLLSSQLKNEITERIQRNKTLEHAGLGLKVQPHGRLIGGLVSDNGVIFLVSEDPAAVVSLTPQLKNATTGELQWTCLGYPTRTMPAQCRAAIGPTP
jgi:hypothetical protein